MKSEQKILVLALLLLGLTSWISGIYIDEVNGLFTASGIRWIVVNAMPNFAAAPLAKIVCALVVAGGLSRCGIHEPLAGGVSHKQRRALHVTLAAVVLFAVLLASLTLLPGTILLSAFGTLAGSPLQKGWFGVVCLFLLIISSVYGYTSGRFARFADWQHAHTALLSAAAPYFITLFLSAQFIAILDYSDLLCLTRHEQAALAVLRPMLYYLPLLRLLPFACHRPCAGVDDGKAR